MSDFVHLHMHTEYSTLDGINRVDTLPEHIESLGQKAVAITDHGNISGSYRFVKECRAKNIKPIVGLEAYYTPHDAAVRELDDLGKRYYHMVLLAKNGQGLANLRWLSTKAFTEGFYSKPRLDDRMIADHAEGIIATSACLGSRISQLILHDRKTEAEKMLLHHNDMFRDNFFIEVQLHAEKEQQIVNQVLIDIAQRHNLPLILTNDCHYTHEQDKILHEQALCMSTNAKMSDPPWDPERKANGATGKTRFSFGPIDVHVAHHDWMWRRAQAQGIPYEAIANTVAVAAAISSDEYFMDIRNRYPRYQRLDPGETSWGALEYLAKELLWQKMDGKVPQAYRDRMDHELSIIKKMGFYDYLLIVHQFLEGARGEDVFIGPGRGSAAGSLVSYALGITQVDPIKYGLVFERWLNYGRAARPILMDQQMIKAVKEMAPCAGPCSHDHHH
jgi:DNA polymerase-3 subunit alpha